MIILSSATLAAVVSILVIQLNMGRWFSRLDVWRKEDAVA